LPLTEQKTETQNLPSINELKNICQKFYKDPNGPLSETFSRYTYHKITIYISWLFLHTKISPNQVSLMSLITGLAGCIFLTLPGLYPIIGIILFNLTYILDIVDGDIARFRKICSLSGAFFDRLTTAIIDPLAYLALAYAVYSRIGDINVFFFGVSAAFSLLLFKTVNGYLHLAVLEPVMHKKHSEMFNLQDKSPKDDVVTTFFDYRPSNFFFKISEFILGFGLYLGLYFVVLMDSLFNFSFSLFSNLINFSYIFLIITGVCLPIVCMGSITYIIKQKIPEQLYTRFFSK
jgi:phosphatidylglycerophosphate synthase